MVLMNSDFTAACNAPGSESGCTAAAVPQAACRLHAVFTAIHLLQLPVSLTLLPVVGHTSQFIMPQNPEIDYSLGSPPPTIACPYCPRYFKTKSGRTRHIQAKHSDRPDTTAAHPHPSLPLATASPGPSGFVPSLPPYDGFDADMDIASPILSLPQPSFHNPSPVPSHFAPSFPPSCDGFNADRDMNIASPILSSPQLSFHNPSPVPSHFAPSFPPSCDGFNADRDMDIASPVLSSPQPSFHNPSPVPSHFAPSFPPSCDGFRVNADRDMDIASPILSSPQPSFHDPSPVPSHFAPSSPSCDRSIDIVDIASESHSIPSSSQPSFHDISPVPSPVPDTSRVTRAFHPKLDGMSIFFFTASCKMLGHFFLKKIRIRGPEISTSA